MQMPSSQGQATAPVFFARYSWCYPSGRGRLSEISLIEYADNEVKSNWFTHPGGITKVRTVAIEWRGWSSIQRNFTPATPQTPPHADQFPLPPPCRAPR